jgi:hypothetical protein
MTKHETKQEQRLPQWSLILLVTSVVTLLFSGSFFIVMSALTLGDPAESLPDVGHLATILFGASSLALIIFSLLVAGVAVSGWQTLKNDVRKEVEAATHKRIDILEKEFRGRSFSIFGFMIGALHSNPNQLDQGENKDYLAEAADHCRKAYNILKEIEGNAKYTALNNLVYYSCLSGEETARDYLLEQAHILKKIGQEKNHPDSLLTYCRAILQYSSNINELQDARSMGSSLLRTSLTSERQKKEANFYVASLTDKINDLLRLPA